MKYSWVTAKNGVIREWFTDMQKNQERTPFVPADHEWVALSPPQARPRLQSTVDGTGIPRPIQRWVIGPDGIVLVEDISDA